MRRICFSFIYQITSSRVKVNFCKHKQYINKVNMASNASLTSLKNILRLCGSSVDNFVKSARNIFGFYLCVFISKDFTHYDQHAGFLWIRLLLIARRIITMHKASVVSSSSLKSILLWRESDFYKE